MLELSNVKLVALPPNTTAKKQPLDQGIIKNFKTKYHKQLLQWIVTRVDGWAEANNLTKEINPLTAIGWIKDAWTEVGVDCIKNCFVKAGIFEEQLTDPCKDGATLGELAEFEPIVSMSDMEVAFESEESFQTCDNNEQWKKDFFANIVNNDRSDVQSNNGLDESDDEDECIPTRQEARSMISGLISFCKAHEPSLYGDLMNLSNKFERVCFKEKLSKFKQTRLTDFNKM
jgi:hypothetical protein